MTLIWRWIHRKYHWLTSTRLSHWIFSTMYMISVNFSEYRWSSFSSKDAWDVCLSQKYFIFSKSGVYYWSKRFQSSKWHIHLICQGAKRSRETNSFIFGSISRLWHYNILFQILPFNYFTKHFKNAFLTVLNNTISDRQLSIILVNRNRKNMDKGNSKADLLKPSINSGWQWFIPRENLTRLLVY